MNDLVVQGAEPLFFLDYFATGRLAPQAAAAVVAGSLKAAAGRLRANRRRNCGNAGMYGEGDYDLAGFSVGAAEQVNFC